MKLYVNGAEKEITLRAWNGESWGPDFFADAEVGYENWQEVTAEEYEDLVKAWEDEVDDYNNKRWSESLGDYDANFAVELMHQCRKTGIRGRRHEKQIKGVQGQARA